MNFVRKNKISIILLLSIMIISILSFSIMCYGDEKDNLTITTENYNDEIEMAKEFVKTLNDSDVFQNFQAHYTTDSPGYTPEPPIGAGEDVNTGIRYADLDQSGKLPTVNGEKVDSFKVTLTRSEHMTTEEFSERVADHFNTPDKSKTYYDIYKNSPNFKDGVPYGYLAKDGKNITVEATISKEGKVVLHLPDNFPEGIYAVTHITINGVNYEVQKFDRVYARNGEVENPSDPGSPSTPQEDDDQPNESHRWANISISTATYKHKEPSRNGSISSDIYNVSEAIPTSENLKFAATADDSLYSVTERKYVGTAGVRDITLVANATYIVPCYCTKKVYKKDENGKNNWTDGENCAKIYRQQ